MAETIDDRAIINRALARIGASPVASLTEETAKARQARAVFDDRIEAMLALHEWSFAGKTYALDQIPESDADFDGAAKKFNNGWRYGFALPGDRLGPPRRVLDNPRRPDTPLREFTVEQDRLFAGVKPLWCQVTVRAAPAVWSPAFRLAAIVALAADLAIPITQDKGLAGDLREQAEGSPNEGGRGGLVGKAIAHDHASAPRKAPLWQDPLTSARLA